MSVQHNIYLMYGMRIDDFPEEKLEEMDYEWGKASAYTTKVEHKDGLFLLFDHMSGDYCILGHVIGKTSDDGDSSLEIVQELGYLGEETELRVQESIRRNFGLEPQCKYYLINHYS